MANTPQQGIMALPETDQANVPQLSLHESYGAAKQGLADADPNFSAMYDNEMSKAMPALLALSDEELDSLLQIVQYLQEDPEQYKTRLAELEKENIVEKGDFPEEYDENFLAVFGAAVMEAQKTNQPAAPQGMQPPMQLAKGGIAEAARLVASHGRSGDTMLAHINKDEAALLKKHGGWGTINPRTGLPEYGLGSFVKSVVGGATSAVKGVTSAVSSAIKSVGSAVKQVLASPVGRIVATVALAAFIGPAAFGLTGAAGVAAQMGLASAGITALSGGNLKDVVRAGTTGAVLGYGGAALGPAIGGSVGVTSAAGQAALGAGLTATGLGAVTGKSIKDSVKDGLASAAIAGAMTYANSEGVSRGTQGQDPSKVPVDERSILTPDQAGQVSVNQQTGQVTQQTNQLGQPTPQTPGQTNLSTEPGINVRSTSADPLGDFMAQNEAVRNAAATPVAKPEPTFWDSTKQWYNENLSPSGRAAAGEAQAKADALKAYNEDIAAGLPKEIAVSNYQNAVKAATPGILSTYGPAVAAGLGITALSGGFQQQQPQMTPEQQDIYTGKATQDIISANPKNYITQNLPGVTYDAAGNITGSAPWTPRSGAGTTEVAGDYIAYKPSTHAAAPAPVYAPAPTYVAPANAIGGGRQIYQPYNTASMYDFRPRYAAQGGMMETQGAFPSNPLTMPSSPLMAMDSQRLPMNTPGVPMNTPMGFAEGGLASLPPAHFALGGSSDWAASIRNAIKGLEPQLKEMVAPVKEGLADMKTYFQAAPTGGGGGTAPVASAVASTLHNAGYGTPVVAAAPAPQVAAPQIAPVQYTPVPYVAPNAPLTTADANEIFARRLYPSLYDADFQARLRQGARRPQQAATGGIASLAPGGYPRRTGQISGPGTETSDDIPAMLSDGEFVMTAKAVRGLGKGSRRAGAKKMYALMHQLEKNAARG